MRYSIYFDSHTDGISPQIMLRNIKDESRCVIKDKIEILLAF